ncbi:sodium/calcium exchanger protein [Knoellia koreensis]|uniref:Sodium:proton exchanger n=1 Tax=Knoellia koreensis TaxID=2730921 RepID=A0A849HTC4_9MICO|nr:sodium:proton exchanger [Knoellia sp. DB2414S]NNM47827.1 sodium:proton exchanger [Knoellia sp. DB2414S]
MSSATSPGPTPGTVTRRSGLRIAAGLGLPLLAALPGLWLRLSGASVPPAVAAALFAAAVVGAAFLLTWGTELAEIDIGQGLALALLALIAVLPEYAVDVVFAWLAGQDPDRYAPLALANMTGANRLLIGVGWSVVALAALAAARRARRTATGAGGSADTQDEPNDGHAVQLHRVQVVELAYLAVASAYALTLPLRSTLTIVDAVILFAIFGAYLWRVRAVEQEPDPAIGDGDSDPQEVDDDTGREGGDEEGQEESELFGPAAAVAQMPARARRVITVGMLAAAAAVILAVAEPFAQSLVATGEQLHVSQFLLVQWVAPLASETPEFIAVLLLALKLQSAAALGALISSKINQWTLLVGILPLVFAVSAGSLAGLPIDPVQREELLLTAAQSVFAVALVVTGRLTRSGAWALLGLFTAQFVAAWTAPADLAGTVRLSIAAVYLVLGVGLLVVRRRHLVRVLRTGLRPPRSAAKTDRVENRAGGGR